MCLGDSNQNGSTVKFKGIDNSGHAQYIKRLNITKTPKLGMSLRENNIQKSSNIRMANVVLDLIDTINSTTDAAYVNDMIKGIIGLPMSSYNTDNVLNGEHITSSLDESFFDNKSKDEQIGYIYDNVDSDTYKLMKKKEGEGYNIKFFTETEVQGYELPYFVIDVN